MTKVAAGSLPEVSAAWGGCGRVPCMCGPGGAVSCGCGLPAGGAAGSTACRRCMRREVTGRDAFYASRAQRQSPADGRGPICVSVPDGTAAESCPGAAGIRRHRGGVRRRNVDSSADGPEGEHGLSGAEIPDHQNCPAGEAADGAAVCPAGGRI